MTQVMRLQKNWLNGLAALPLEILRVRSTLGDNDVNKFAKAQRQSESKHFSDALRNSTWLHGLRVVQTTDVNGIEAKTT